MRLSRLYIDQPLALTKTFVLPPEAGHYLAKVLRVKISQTVVLFNGDGFEYTATITAVTKAHVSVEISKQQVGQAPSPLHTHLGQVISRGDRMDYAIQKACEMGATEITPLFSARCEVKLETKRLHKRHQHWQQIAIHASEQSGRNRPPIIHLPTDMSAWTKSCSSDCRLVLHPHQSSVLDKNLSPKSCSLLVGPEGGFSDEEIIQVMQDDFQTILLGPRILRTETAPVAALALVQSIQKPHPLRLWHWGVYGVIGDYIGDYRL